MEYRMYGLVNYQLSGSIHAGIQFAHALVEYQQAVRSFIDYENKYNQWAQNDKTIIILNGGTTNENPDKFGTLQLHTRTLNQAGIFTTSFREPDLNDTQTAVAFLVDERVWDRVKYPDFTPVYTGDNESFDDAYSEWLESIGGEKNLFLRTFLSNFRLA